MRVLVTGGSGFIGQHVCAELRGRGHHPTILDRTGHSQGGELCVTLGDVRDATAVTEAVAHADGVIHLAGVLGTQETITNPRPAAETNILGAVNVLEACAQYRLPLVNIAVGNWFETNTYSVTKTCAARLCEMYRRYRDVAVSIVRAYNAYGPGQALPPPYGASKVRKVIPSMAARALSGQTVQVYGDGQQVMDMVYAGDVANVLVSALEEAAEGRTGDIEAGTGRPTTVADIANAVINAVQEQAGILAMVEHLPMRPGETPHSIVMADPGLPACISLEDGLALTVPWLQKVLA